MFSAGNYHLVISELRVARGRGLLRRGGGHLDQGSTHSTQADLGTQMSSDHLILETLSR